MDTVCFLFNCRCSSGTENRFANGTKPEISINLTNNLEINKNVNIHEVQAKTSKVNEREPFVSSSSSPSETVTSKISNSNRSTKVYIPFFCSESPAWFPSS